MTVYREMAGRPPRSANLLIGILLRRAERATFSRAVRPVNGYNLLEAGPKSREGASQRPITQVSGGTHLKSNRLGRIT